MGSLVKDAYTWSSLAYFVLHMPLAMAFFAMMAGLLALFIGITLAPLAHLLFDPTPAWALLALGAAGFAGLVGTLHLGLLLGRFQGWLAKQMLVRRQPGGIA